MKKYQIVKILLLVSVLFTGACDEVVYVGSSETGYKKELPYRVTPSEAHKKAEPWLDKTYKLKLKRRLSRMDRPLTDTIVVKGDWYYVSRDNYPYKSIYAYIRYAVRVHVSTGKVIPPEDD